jgi:glycosyltransferase involved in cell wall biosynthesis
MLESKIREFGVESRVHLIGHREDRGNVLSALDLYIVASNLEGLSNAMAEALSLGIPVVSTPVSGAHEALAPLSDGRVPGVVIDGTDPRQLAAVVAPLLQDPAARARMGEAGRQRVREDFDFERGIDRWEAVLRGEPVLP